MQPGVDLSHTAIRHDDRACFDLAGVRGAPRRPSRGDAPGACARVRRADRQVRARVAVDLPRTQQRLVEAWAEIHHDELLRDWNLLQSGQPPFKIEPLR